MNGASAQWPDAAGSTGRERLVNRRYTRDVSLEWRTVEIVDTDELADEPLGTKQKFWVTNPDDDRPWLFKFARVREGRTLGEDWAEWLVHHLGERLGAPTALIHPAICDSRRGIVSRSVIDSVAVERLVHGNSLLVEVDPSYDPIRGRNNPRYTVAAVQAALDGVQAPLEFAGPSIMDGFDVWAGYLVLDAWVAGRDRHHENWGVLSSQQGRTLAPSYDHGNALGFQERPEHILTLNADPQQRARWLSRGRSHHFAGRPALVDLAHEALQSASEDARNFWKTQLSSLDSVAMSDIVRSVPREIMSDPAHTFALDILTGNRERLLRDYPGR